MTKYGAIDPQPGLHPMPRASRKTASIIAAATLALVAVAAIGMLTSSSRDTELLQMRRPKTNFHRFRTMQKLLSSEPQSKLQSFGSGQGTGGNAGMSVEKLANELAMDGTKAVNMQTHYESACHQELTQFESAVNMNNPMLIPGMTEEQLMIGKGSLEIFNLEDQDHSGCIDLMEYHHMLYVLHDEDPELCYGILDDMCGTHFDDSGVLNTEGPHGADADFHRIDTDNSGLLSINEVADLIYDKAYLHKETYGHMPWEDPHGEGSGHHGTGSGHHYGTGSGHH